MRDWRTVTGLVFLVIGVSAMGGTAFAQDGGGETAQTASSAGDFFVSRITHSDGSQSIDLVGSFLLWLLLAMSVVNVGLIAHLAIANKRAAFLPPAVVDAVKRLLLAGKHKEALEVSAADQSYFARIMHPALSQSIQGHAAMVKGLEQATDVQLTARMRPIEVLYMFGQISPMMGLLGTVYGIIFAFRVFVSMSGHASPSLLAAGIGTALVATFWGLVVAIPALAGYSMLRNKVDQLSLQATIQAEELLGTFKPKPAGRDIGTAAVESGSKHSP